MVELLTVIIIIGLLAGMLLPSLVRMRDRGRIAVCRENLRKIGQGCLQYSHDWGDFYPTVAAPNGAAPSNPLKSLALLFDNYVPLRDVFRCPSTSDMCIDLKAGDTFLPHGQPDTTSGSSERKECSYGYDDMKGRMTDPGVAIAADSKPSPEDSKTKPITGAGVGVSGQTAQNSGNHRFSGQNVLFYDGHVNWFSTNFCGLDGDDIYNAVNPTNLGETDSYIHQNDDQ